MSTLQHTLLSEPQVVFDLDLSEEQLESEVEVCLPAVRPGDWHAVVCWHDLEIGHGQNSQVVSCCPSEPHTWQAVLFRGAPRVVQGPGESMVIRVSHDVHNLRIQFPDEEVSTPCPDADEHQPVMTVSSVSRWHWGMMQDDQRNSMYDLAITKAMSSRRVERVLDIGSGSGLLAMMVARAAQGSEQNSEACEIVTIEAVETIANVAKSVIEANGFGDKIRVINAMSTELEIGQPGMLDQVASLCVSEIVDVGLLGEFCLPTMAHARHKLLAHDAQVIPCRAQVHAALFQIDRTQPAAMRRPLGLDDGFGLDLRAFNLFASETYEQVDIRQLESKRLTAVLDVFEFDLTGRQDRLDSRVEMEVDMLEPGECHAIGFWFTLHLDDQISICTSPETPTCWNQAVYFWPEPALQVKKGDKIKLACCHEPNRVYFEPVSYTHLRAHETPEHLVCRLLLEKKKKQNK
eukprot:TRINITY_DN24333_c0_g1_i2.p1 TRINITY_DN24333_c0_g1~~TRINITY_DN24333_c0_g1_i2.p1  ORF type:complete len:461 (-),score=112.08 TRINITY_DN24333_c0_g1_i2:58-1440(-)